MSSWQDKAVRALEDSLFPVPQELNTIDWKCTLSDNSEKLAHHLCAFSNTHDGGFLVYGVDNDAQFVELSKDDIELIVSRLGSIAKNNLAWSIQLEHAVIDYKDHALLFIRIPEQTNKPIYMRGKDIYEAYIRSAGHTVKMSREQIHEMIALSHGISFEDRVAMNGVQMEEVERLLDWEMLFEKLDKKVPSERQLVMKQMQEYGLIVENSDRYDIMNLGAILFARRLKDFPMLCGKEIIVRKYQGTNNRVLSMEYHCQSGCAVGFDDLIAFVCQNTSHACLLYEDGLSINNQSVRERFSLNKNQSVMASRILADTFEKGLIKMENPEMESKRYTAYIPYYG